MRAARARRDAAEVKRSTRGAGVDVALEIVGSTTFGQTLRCMAPGGRVVVVVNLDTGTFDLNPGLVIVRELGRRRVPADLDLLGLGDDQANGEASFGLERGLGGLQQPQLL